MRRGAAVVGRDERCAVVVNRLEVESAALLLERGARELGVRDRVDIAAVVLVERLELELQHKWSLHLPYHRDPHLAPLLAMAHALSAPLGVVRIVYADGAGGRAGPGRAEDHREQGVDHCKHHHAATAAPLVMEAVASCAREGLL